MVSWIPQVRNRLRNHLRAGSTDRLTSQVHRFPIHETYLQQPSSRDQVARLAPFPIIPSGLLSQGQVVADIHPNGNIPIMVHRDRRSGEIKAYRNQCRYRGAPLINEGIENMTPMGSIVTCPYHAWTYDLSTGNLRGVPGAKEGFPCLDKKAHSLAELPCMETAGAIWVGGDDYKSKTLWSLADVDSELNTLLPSASGEMEGSQLIGYREWKLEANWQLLVETFLESYHVSALHKDTLGLVAHSNVMVTDVLDSRSFRMTVPLKNFDTTDDDNDTNVPTEPFFSQTTTTYFLFPHTAVSIFKRFAMYLSIVPCSDNGSRVRAWGIKHGGDDTDDNDNELHRRDFDSVVLGVEEDWSCAEAIQRGIMAAGHGDDSNSLTHFTYGRFEGGNVTFLQNVGLAAEEIASET